MSQGIFEGFSTVDRQHPACNLERAGSATQGKVKLREMRDTLTAVRGQDFLAGPVVMNPPANAEDMDSIPDPGGFQLQRGNRPCAVTTEPACCN